MAGIRPQNQSRIPASEARPDSALRIKAGLRLPNQGRIPPLESRAHLWSSGARILTLWLAIFASLIHDSGHGVV